MMSERDKGGEQRLIRVFPQEMHARVLGSETEPARSDAVVQALEGKATHVAHSIHCPAHNTVVMEEQGRVPGECNCGASPAKPREPRRIWVKPLEEGNIFGNRFVFSREPAEEAVEFIEVIPGQESDEQAAFRVMQGWDAELAERTKERDEAREQLRKVQIEVYGDADDEEELPPFEEMLSDIKAAVDAVGQCGNLEQQLAAKGKRLDVAVGLVQQRQAELAQLRERATEMERLATNNRQEWDNAADERDKLSDAYAQLRERLAGALAMTDIGSDEFKAAFPPKSCGSALYPRETIPGWRVVEKIRETLLDGSATEPNLLDQAGGKT